jgi:hypothetical protein
MNPHNFSQAEHQGILCLAEWHRACTVAPLLE